MADDLAVFIRTRLDEDEAAAKAWLPLGNPTAAQREHIARQDPGRVLREAEAKRAILARYEDCRARMDDYDYSATTAEQVREYEDFVLPDLAAVYSDHPDYQPEWKP